MAHANIVINDTLQTRQISLPELANSFKNYQSTPNIPGKKTLLITMDEPRQIEIIPGTYYEYSDYDYTQHADPLNALNGPWTLSTDQYFSTWRNYGEIPFNISTYSQMDNGLLMLDYDWRNYEGLYFIDQLSQDQINKIAETGIGTCEFEIAVPKFLCARPNSPFNWTAAVDSDKTYLIDNDITSLSSSGFRRQQAFVSWGLYEEDNPNLMFRFMLKFCVLEDEDGNWFTNIYRNSTDGAEAIPLAHINGWDGLSFKRFICEYGPNINGDIRGTLYLIENGIKNPVPIAEDIAPSTNGTINPNSSQFGFYNYESRGAIAIRYFSFKAYVADDYRIKVDEQHYDTAQNFLLTIPETYNFTISGSGTADINWGFAGHVQQNRMLSDNLTISLNDWPYSASNANTLLNFSKRNKLISIFVDGDLTKIEAPNKQISRINVVDFSNLLRLDLSNNKLSTLDLSNNTALTHIDVSNNPNLTALILPSDSDGKNVVQYLDMQNTKIKTLEFIGSGLPLPLEIKFQNTPQLTKLTLCRIELTDNSLSAISSASYPELEHVDISESNILTNKSILESFLDKLPNRTGKSAGIIYLYGEKYTVNGEKGNARAIASTLQKLKLKNWVFYL